MVSVFVHFRACYWEKDEALYVVEVFWVQKASVEFDIIPMMPFVVKLKEKPKTLKAIGYSPWV